MAIITKPTYVISESAAVDDNDPIIGYDTVTFDYTCSDVTVSTEAEDYPRDAPLEPNTFERWKPTAMPGTWELTFDSGTAVDFVGIAGHTLGSSGATVLVEYSSGGSYTTFAAQVVPSDDKPLLFLDDSVTADSIRVTVSGSTIPEIGVVYIGERLTMQRRLYGGHSPINYNRNTAYSTSTSRGGYLLDRSIRKKGIAGSISVDHLTAAWFRANFDAFMLHARQYPFFFAWRPTKYPLEIVYVMTDGEITFSNMGVVDLMQISMNVMGPGYDE